jgi:hypothetical protein
MRERATSPQIGVITRRDVKMGRFVSCEDGWRNAICAHKKHGELLNWIFVEEDGRRVLICEVDSRPKTPILLYAFVLSFMRVVHSLFP